MVKCPVCSTPMAKIKENGKVYYRCIVKSCRAKVLCLRRRNGKIKQGGDEVEETCPTATH